MRVRLLAVVAATVLLAGGCAATTQQGGRAMRGPAMTGMSMTGMTVAGMTVAGMTMAGMTMRPGAASGRPSAAAAMICNGETGQAVRRSFELRAVPPRQRMWMPPVYGCTWTLPHGRLQLAVDDARTVAEGQRRFAQLWRSVPGTERLGGVAALGFPAFQSPVGVVVFLKDGKVLSVDARRVARADLPAGFSREDAAYAVASAVIACWSE